MAGCGVGEGRKAVQSGRDGRGRSASWWEGGEWLTNRIWVSQPSTLWLWNAKSPILWLLLWKQLCFPFSKIFFPYLSDPSGEIHLLDLTPASFSTSGTRAARLRHTDIHTQSHTCTPAAQKQRLTTDCYSRPLCCMRCSTSRYVDTNKV